MRKLPIVFFILVFESCGNSGKPKAVLTQPQLTALLIDVYLAEARAENLRVKNMALIKDSSIRFFIPFEQKLLKSRGISDSVMRITYTYYLAHPKEFESVYDAVVDTLVLRDQRMNRAPKPKFVPQKPK
jgi:hypothetical protein